MDRYVVPRYVHFCKTCDGLVFLDLRKDKYVGIGGDELEHLQPYVVGWPFEPPADSTADMFQRAEHVAKELCAAGLLTKDTAQGKPAALAKTQRGRLSLLSSESDTRARMSLALLFRLIRAALVIGSILKFQSLERAIARVRARRERFTERSEREETLIGLIRSFHRLRPLVYGARGKCLFDSLVLLEFLWGFGFAPSMVFGVSTFPFKAHCWLQQEGLVLTDLVERTSGFTPILVI